MSGNMLKLLFIGAIFLFMAMPVNGAEFYLGINSSYYNDSCGWTGGESPLTALDGTGRWLHNVNFWHWVDLDLGQVYDVTHIRGRSDGSDDPTDVYVWVAEVFGEWGDPVLSSISDWQDTSAWVTHAITPYARGQYVRALTFTTEDINNFLAWGKLIGSFTILDIRVNDDPEYPPGIPQITSPTAGENITEDFYINWTTTGDVNNDTYNASVYITNLDGTINRTIADNNITNGTTFAFVKYCECQSGTFRINVTLCDFHEPFSKCSSNLTDWNFSIINQPPIVTITAPINQSYNVTDTPTELALNYTVTDPEGDSVNCWYNINGGENISAGTEGWCYQEYADQASACGGLASGSYESASQGLIKANYTKPEGALNTSLWQLKWGGHAPGKNTTWTYNLTIPKACWDAYDDRIMLLAQLTLWQSPFWTDILHTKCHNGTDWQEVQADQTFQHDLTGGSNCGTTEQIDASWITGRSATCFEDDSAWIYEDAMYWKKTCANTVIPNLTDGSYTVTVFANDTFGNIADDSIGFSIATIPIFTMDYVSPTPEDNAEVGFDATVIINMSFTNNTAIDSIIIDWDGTNYTLNKSGGYGEYNPTISLGTIYNYRGYINTTLGVFNSTEERTLIVSTFTQSELDSRFTVDDLMIILLFVFVGIMVIALIKIK